MELHFGENIKRMRREKNLTQEALANALGVTAQSVSKWECAYGYPDITWLPGIANFFGVTVDALLSNDAASREAEFARFEEQYRTYAEGSEEKIAFIREYCRRYPDEPVYAYYLSGVLRNHIELTPMHRAKYLPLLRETAEKLLEDPEYRTAAIRDMIRTCEEEEVPAWLALAPYNANATRRSMLINRCVAWDDTEKLVAHQGLEAIENMAKQLESRFPDKMGPVKKADYHRRILAVLASFGEDGTVPDGWLAFYAYKQLVLAACLFGQGDTDGGRAAFASAMEKWYGYHSLSDEFLDMGGILFGNVRVDKAWHLAVDEKGTQYKLYGTLGIGRYGRASEILSLLENPRWAWFNAVRSEDWFADTVAALREMARTEKLTDEEE